MSQSQLITIAKIIKARGTRGEVAAEILTDFPDRFESLKEVFLQKESAPPRSFILDSFWFHKERVILKFKGIDGVSPAEVLRGYEVKIPKSEVVPLTEGSCYQFDLIGCAVRSLDGHEYGSVTGVLDAGGNYLLEIDRESDELLIPFAESMFVKMDFDKKELICNLPEGLEDL